MIVSCPNCSTRFNLPEAQAQPGSQLRCSVCKQVFTLPDDDEDILPAPAPQRPARTAPEAVDNAPQRSRPPRSDDTLSLDAKPERKGKKRTTLVVTLVLFLCVIGGGAGVWVFMPHLLGNLPFLSGASQVAAPTKDMVSKISLRGVRQYSIANEKLGQLSIIEGKAVNGFEEPRELIRIEAALYDKDGKTLDSKQQMAGTNVSLFQLQVLGEQELEQALGNKIDILSNNTNVPPNGEVPFMLVFYKPAETAVEFGVKVIDAKMPPTK